MARPCHLLNGNLQSCGCRKTRRVKPELRHDLVGQRFGRLVVVERAPDGRKRKTGKPITRWRCLCDCGTYTETKTELLRRGECQSCGCLGVEKRKTACKTHGESKTRMHRIWCNMLSRCLNPSNPQYKSYGGRGIDVDPRWAASYETFRDEMGPPPTPRHSVGRVDNDRGYWPSNTRWETPAQQSRNTRRNIRLVHNGVEMVLFDWVKVTGVSWDTLRKRVAQFGRDGVISSLTTHPIRKRRRNSNADPDGTTSTPPGPSPG